MVGEDFFGVADVGFAHLEEASAGAEKAEAFVDEVSGEGVEDHVDALVGGGLAEGFGEVEGAGGSEVGVVEAEGADSVPFWEAGGAENFGAEVVGELDRGHAYASGGGVHQDPLAGLQVAKIYEGVPGGQEHQRDGGGLFKAQGRRHGDNQLGVSHRGRGEGGVAHAQHRVAHLEVRDVAAQLGDYTGEFEAEPGDRDHTEGVEDVAKVHARGADGDAHVGGGEGFGDDGRGHKAFEAALLGEVDSPLAFGGGEDLTGGGGGETGREEGVVADGAFGLGVVIEGGLQDVQVRRVGAAVDGFDDPAGGLAAGAAKEAPEGGASEIGHAVVGAGGDCAPGDPHEVAGGEALVAQETLQQHEILGALLMNVGRSGAGACGGIHDDAGGSGGVVGPGLQPRIQIGDVLEGELGSERSVPAAHHLAPWLPGG